MALRLLREAQSEFDIAKARWIEISDRRRELKSKLAGAEAALALACSPPQEGDPASPVIAARAAEYLGRRKPSVETLRGEVRQLLEAAAEAADGYTVERAAWAAAVEAEGRRLAALLAPRHRKAVARIAAAVEQLSAAVEAERAVRAEMLEVGSALLPDAGHEFGSLVDYSSAVSSWNRRMIALGLLP